MATVAYNDATRIITMHGRDKIRTLAFHPDGKYIFSGGTEGKIRQWGVEDGHEVGDAMDAVRPISSISISKDGRWIVSVGGYGIVIIWDAESHKKVAEAVGHSTDAEVVDISPLSTTFATGSRDRSAIIWDIQTGEKRAGPLWHEVPVYAVKFSRKGDRVATAQSFPSPVHIFGSETGELLAKTQVTAEVLYALNIVWSPDDQFLYTVPGDRPKNGTIHVLDSWTGSLVSEWPVQDAPFKYPRLASSVDAHLFALHSNGHVSFWDVATKDQIASTVVPASDYYWTMVLSLDDRYLASGGEDKQITIRNLCDIIPQSYLNPGEAALGSQDEQNTIPNPTGGLTRRRLPLLQVSNAAFRSWMRDDLTGAEATLTDEITRASNDTHYDLANRALVRERMRDWCTALQDATESIRIQPSAIGYIAMAIAHIGSGEREACFREFNLAFECCDSQDIDFLLLTKCVALSAHGNNEEGIFHVNDLAARVINLQFSVDNVYVSFKCNLYVRRGDAYMERGDYEHAIQSFERAQLLPRSPASSHLEVISLMFGWRFDDLWITARRHLCEALHAAGRTMEAAESVLQLINVLEKEVQTSEEIAGWVTDFTNKCVAKLEAIGDAASQSGQHEEAIEQYSIALSLNPATAHGLFLKRGKTRALRGSWDDALRDVNKAITLDPLSPCGYEQKHAVFHGMGRHADAIDAYKTMLSKLEQLSDPQARARRFEYVDPSDTEAVIRNAVERAIRDSPRVLIHTINGRLHDRAMQISASEDLPFFKKLVSEMTTQIDQARIEVEVKKHCRYVMLSHMWEQNEPLFQTVENKSVYNLERSPANDKLRKFCMLTRDTGFYWAWSDTVCIDKNNQVVLQEALVSMFAWYSGSSLTLVYLLDVGELSEPGALQESAWNTRGWTFQEYVASKVIQFFTKDWTPYLGLRMFNHKNAPEVMLEMERVTGVPVDDLLSLCPGSEDVREKLCLASRRHTTLVEDIAYSLLGIFSVKTMTVIYGEGKQALGRFLGIVLTDSGDASVLAWTGGSGSYNSCLPDDVTVFQQLADTHIPQPLADTEMETAIAQLRASSLNTEPGIALYDRLNELSRPWFVAKRLKLPCIVFPLGPLATPRSRRPVNTTRVYRARTAALGIVEIKTRDDLSHYTSLYLVHPWIDALIDRERPGLAVDDLGLPPLFPDDDDLDSDDDAATLEQPTPLNEPPLIVEPSRAPAATMDKQTRALRLVARLRQPFGGLLLAPLREGGVEYKRVATDSLIIAQVREEADLRLILGNVRTLDVL